MLKIFSKILSTTLAVTIVNFTVVLIAARELDPETFGYVGLLQHTFNIILRISYFGVLYEILRYGDRPQYEMNEYNLNIKSLSLSALFLLIISSSSLFLVNDLSKVYTSALFPLIALTLFIVVINSAVLRSLQNYALSNLLDKSLIISVVGVYITLLIFDSSEAYLLIVFFVISVLLLLASFRLLKSKISLRKIYRYSKPKVQNNIRLQMYFAEIMMLAATSIDKIIINQTLSIGQLAIWLLYYQLFIPFEFIGRLLHQVFYPEIARDRILISRRKIIYYLIAIVILSSCYYFPSSILFGWLYGSKYNLSNTSIILMCVLGFSYLLYMPVGLFLGAKGLKATLGKFNIGNLIITAFLLLAYFKFSESFFPNGIIISLISYWSLKFLLGLILIIHDKRSNNN